MTHKFVAYPKEHNFHGSCVRCGLKEDNAVHEKESDAEDQAVRGGADQEGPGERD